MSRQPSKETDRRMPWKNLHDNVRVVVDAYHQLYNPLPPKEATVLDDIKATSAYVCSILADAAAHGITVRSVGGAWSLSDVAVCSDVMLDTKKLNLRFPVDASSIDPTSNHDANRIFYMQCGCSVGEVYRYLEGKSYTLPTIGASNGQTIAGAVSTGTHGSAFSYGAIQECVVGIHLIVGPDPSTDCLIIERASDPVLAPNIPQRLGARMVLDDNLFNAALVSFGSMGFIMGYVINAEPLYHLESWRRVVPYNGLVKAMMTTLDVDLVPLIVPNLTVYPENIWHVEVVLNPHDPANAYLTVMERWSTHRTLSLREPAANVTPGDDLLSVIGHLTSSLPSLAGAATSTLLKATYGNRGPVVATPYVTFNAASVRGTAMSAEIGVPFDRSVDAVDILTACKEINHYAGIIACRFVKASPALLAFTHFPVTCTIELPGVKTSNTQKFYDAAYAALFASDIPVTAHWGQIYPKGDAILDAYGSNVDRWLDARRTLLSPVMQSVFGHPAVPPDVRAGG